MICAIHYFTCASHDARYGRHPSRQAWRSQVGTNAATKALEGRDTAAKETEPKEWGLFCLNCLVGLIFAMVNFPRLLQRIVWGHVGNYRARLFLIGCIQTVQSGVARFAGPYPADIYCVMMSYSFTGLFFYVAFLTVFALRYEKLSFLLLGITSPLLGVTALPVIPWIALVALIVLRFLEHVAVLASQFLTIILAKPILEVRFCHEAQAQASHWRRAIAREERAASFRGRTALPRRSIASEALCLNLDLSRTLTRSSPGN